MIPASHSAVASIISTPCFSIIVDHIFLELLKFHLQFMCPALSDSNTHQWTLCVWQELNSAGNSMYGKHFKRKAKGEEDFM